MAEIVETREYVATEQDTARALAGKPWALTGKRVVSRSYERFLQSRRDLVANRGFEPACLPDWLFPFQRHLVEWAVLRGSGALFADCGLGKTPMQLVWAQNVAEKTHKPVLILTPLAVGAQTLREADKFGIQAERSLGEVNGDIVITNYEKLERFDASTFSGVVCDESSILKNFGGARRKQITEFMRGIPYRLLCTATASPNDFDELGTSSEAIGEMGYQDMLSMFFRQQTNKDHLGWGRTKYLLRSHATEAFWRWVCSWSRPIRKPSDYGFVDDGFVLPDKHVRQHEIDANVARSGMLFATPAVTLEEQREERRLTIDPRCEKVAELVDEHDCSVIWCHLNDEGDRLAQIIDGAVQISGSDSDEAKEDKLLGFANGQIKRLITKPRIAGFGMNWQHCAHMVTFPSHSFEQYYQSVRRIWRFGQERPVTVDVVTTHGEEKVLANLQRKADQADEMFAALLQNVTNALNLKDTDEFPNKMEQPRW